MIDFDYVRASDVSDALSQIMKHQAAKFIAGGTNLIDLMKEDVEQPTRLIDITGLPLNEIHETQTGGLKIGALVPNSDLAYDERITKRYPLLSSAILAGASPQLRNMASTGGNLLQRTRCLYFYDTATPCNKRSPGSGCGAAEGVQPHECDIGLEQILYRRSPIGYVRRACALDAVVHVAGPKGDRAIKSTDFHRLPGDTPEIDTNLARDEIIIAIELPSEEFPRLLQLSEDPGSVVLRFRTCFRRCCSED